LAGLVGAGRTDVGRMICGADQIDSGQIFIEGREARIKNPRDAIRYGIGLVPEDRKSQGLVLLMDVKENITLTVLDQIKRIFNIINQQKQNEIANRYVMALSIATPGLAQHVNNLSGGNQQKVVLAKWLSVNPKVMILDEPTRGIDVGAKAEVHALMSSLAMEGMGILMISSEMPEILGMSDRIIVMCQGRITGEFNREEATQEAIMTCATQFETLNI
jgi:ribose transport system ATP-binding protein